MTQTVPHRKRIISYRLYRPSAGNLLAIPAWVATFDARSDQVRQEAHPRGQ